MPTVPSSSPFMSSSQIFTDAEIASLRKGGAILRECLKHVASKVTSGVTTEELDRLAETFIRDHGAVPAFKGYRNFPATLCISINEECVHGLPGPRTLKEGEIISLDGGVLLDGLNTDACVTVGVGHISPSAQQLLDVTKGALDHSLAIVRSGVQVGDISSTIQHTVEESGFHPVISLTGHGIGKSLHQFPDIPNIGEAKTGPRLPARTVVAIEPIVSAGSSRVKEADDGWTLRIADGALSAHFEHTVLVLEDGCEVLA